MDLEFSKEPSRRRRLAVPGKIWTRRADGFLDRLTPIAHDIEVIVSNDETFAQEGFLQAEIEDIRLRGIDRFTRRDNVIGLAEPKEIRFQKPKAIRLGRIGVVHTGAWETIQSWPFEEPSPQDE